MGWSSCARRVEERVEAAGFGGGGESSGVREHVLRGGDDGVGAGGGNFNPVGKVERQGVFALRAARNEVWDGLFGVLRTEGGEEGVEAGEIAGDGDGVDAGVDGAEERSHGATTGAAEGSDAVGVDFRAGEEIVDGADAVPYDDASGSVTDEGGLKAGFAVFASGGFEESFGSVGGVGVLEALALADGVVGEDSEAVAGEGAGEGVVGGFAGEAVAGRDDDAGEFLLGGAGFGFGKIEKRSDGEVGLGFEENFFDAEAVGSGRT